jgi:hypothetical protein
VAIQAFVRQPRQRNCVSFTANALKRLIILTFLFHKLFKKSGGNQNPPIMQKYCIGWMVATPLRPKKRDDLYRKNAHGMPYPDAGGSFGEGVCR